MKIRCRSERGALRGLILAGLLALAACGSRPEPQRDQTPLRDPKGWISSAVVFDPARFGGRWYVAESGAAGCGGAVQHWAFDGSGYRVSGVDCAGTAPQRMDGRLAVTGPGARFTPQGAFGDLPVWVLWVDQDYRVAVLGTPSGRFGMVLSREMPPRSDLIVAARRVLDFNGYTLRRIGR